MHVNISSLSRLLLGFICEPPRDAGENIESAVKGEMTLYTYIEMSMLRGKPPSSPVRVPGRYGVHSRDSTLLVFALS